jgi:hypothetical protein
VKRNPELIDTRQGRAPRPSSSSPERHVAEEDNNADAIRDRGGAMDDFPIVPPLIVKDMPTPRRLATLGEARDFVDDALRLGRPPPWRELWHRLKSAKTEDEAIETIGDLVELLELEDLLLAPSPLRTERQRGSKRG